MVLQELFTFFGAYLNSPTQVGSIFPSSRYLATAIAKELDYFDKIETIQIGGGTGAITKYLPHDRITVLEVDESLAVKLSARFSNVNILNQCGTDFLSRKKTPFGCIVNIPLIGNGNAEQFKSAISTSYKAGHLKWCIIYTYGNISPLENLGFRKVKKARKVWWNIPPASVWVYC